MLTKLRLPSPAMALALLALFIALGGTATAAGVMITSSKQIKDGVILGRDIKKNQITPKHLKKSVKTQIANMPSPALTAAGLLTTRTADFSVAPGPSGDLVVSCAPGEKVTGGGMSSFGALFLMDSRPNTESSWATFAVNFGDAPVAATVWAQCLR